MNTRWSIHYNNNYTDYLDSEEYAWMLHHTTIERELMYPFIGDSRDYYVLGEAADRVANVPGLFCEIGLRKGGGTKILFNSIIASQKERTCISIDPFGSIPFVGMDNEIIDSTEYSNAMQKETLEKIYRFVSEYPKINYIYFPLEDKEFFKRFSDGVPVYANSTTTVCNSYALVHFDGPHDLKTTMEETVFFYKKAPIGAVFVYDDVTHFYDHSIIKSFLEKNGWKQIVETKVKSSYIKMEDKK